MKNIKASTRYAKALLDLSIEKNQLEKVYQDITTLKETCEGSRELVNLLNSPIVKADQKQKALNAVFGSSFNELSISYINLLVSKNREALLPTIAEQFIKAYENHKNILTVEVTSAIKLDEDQKNKVLSLVKHDGEINLVEKTDPSLIGGFIVRMGDKQIDASIAKKFKDLRKEIILN